MNDLKRDHPLTKALQKFQRVFRCFLIPAFGLVFSQPLISQNLLSIYDNQNYFSVTSSLYSTDSLFHTSVRPYMLNEIRAICNYDSLVNSSYHPAGNRDKFRGVIFNKNLIDFKKGDFSFTADPLFDFSAGYDSKSQRNSWTNTRGFLVEGNIGKKFSFSTRFYENQAKFPLYIQNYISRSGVVPGQGMPKAFRNGALDYASSSGYISFSPSKYFNFQFGHGKHFLGDGYRSMMLSDLALNYPYLMINTNVWRIKYVNLFTQFVQPGGSSPDAYPRKYGSFHYLSFLAGKRWNISLFEAIIWQAEDSSGHRGFEVNYLNPIIFYNPLEFSLGSPDNSMMGANLSFKASHQLSFYSQFVIDEWKMKEMLAGDGWHGNKYAWQIGSHWFNFMGVNHLDLQGEYNFVRPYMYAHWKPMQNYAHYREPLAYPFGANTKELIGIAKYNYKRVYLNLKYNMAEFGLDSSGMNFGKNIFSPYTSYVSEYGNKAGQGLKTLMQQLDFSISYLLNPSTNMNFFLSATLRKEENYKFKNEYLLFNFGFRTSLRNLYYDFY